MIILQEMAEFLKLMFIVWSYLFKKIKLRDTGGNSATEHTLFCLLLNKQWKAILNKNNNNLK